LVFIAEQNWLELGIIDAAAAAAQWPVVPCNYGTETAIG